MNAEPLLPKRDTQTERAVCALLHSGAEALALEAYDALPSTNAFLRARAEAGAAEGLTVLAAAQSAGRGRRGRAFYSPPGTGLYMSLLLRPRQSAWHGARITTLAAVAVCEAIEAVAGARPAIKWVNDILLDAKKVCGILAEAAAAGGPESGLRYAVLGIGVNVCPPAEGFPPELRDIAGSVLQAFEPGARCRLAAEILSRFIARYRAEQPDGDMAAYRARCAALGREVSVLLPEGPRAAYAYDVDGEGRLLVRYGDGTEGALSSGEISIRL